MRTRGLSRLMLLAPVVALSSCGSTHTTTLGAAAATSTEGTTERTPQPSDFSGEGCTSDPADASVRVTIYGGESCAEWDRTQSSSGTFWRETQFPSTNAESVVCSMEDPGGHTLIEVRDTGEHFYGNRICAALTSEGWHEVQGPGAQIEHARQQREGEQKAEEERASAARQAEQERARSAEASKREAEQKREEAKQNAENKRLEAEDKRQLEADEQRNREDLRRSEEETRHAEEEANRPQ